MMKRMKQYTTLMLSALLILTGCSAGSGETKKPENDETAKPEETAETAAQETAEPISPEESKETAEPTPEVPSAKPEETIDTLGFCVGRVEGNTYINEGFGLKFVCPEGQEFISWEYYDAMGPEVSWPREENPKKLAEGKRCFDLKVTSGLEIQLSNAGKELSDAEKDAEIKKIIKKDIKNIKNDLKNYPFTNVSVKEIKETFLSKEVSGIQTTYEDPQSGDGKTNPKTWEKQLYMIEGKTIMCIIVRAYHEDTTGYNLSQFEKY